MLLLNDPLLFSVLEMNILFDLSDSAVLRQTTSLHLLLIFQLFFVLALVSLPHLKLFLNCKVPFGRCRSWIGRFPIIFVFYFSGCWLYSTISTPRIPASRACFLTCAPGSPRPVWNFLYCKAAFRCCYGCGTPKNFLTCYIITIFSNYYNY